MLLRFLLFTFATLLLCMRPAWADSPREMVISGLQAPPYVMLDDKGKATGILVDLLQQALQPLNIKPVFRISNWARAFGEAKGGKADAIIPTIKNTNRERLFVFPAEPLSVLHMALLKHSGSNIHFTGDLTELREYRIGKIRKARVAPDFDQAETAKRLKIEERTTFGLLALAVARHRLDLAAGDELMSLWGATENGVLDRVEVLKPYLAEVPVYLAISKTSAFAADVEAISNALALAKRDDAFRASLAVYEKLLQKDLFEHLIKHSRHE